MPGDLKQEIGYLLTLPVDRQEGRVVLPPGEGLTAQRAIALSLVEKALQGDVRAAAFVRESSPGEEGERPAADLESLLRLLEEVGL